MSVDDVLTRLTAGLDEDERIARAAAPTPTTRWVLDSGEVFIVSGDLTGEHRCDQHAQGVPNLCDDVPIGPDTDFDPDGAVVAQMVRQQPRRTMREVEAFRKALAVCDAIEAASLDGSWWEGKYGDFADEIREALAGIYPEPTEEKP